MATAAPITGAPMRAPSIDRRGLLGRIALAPAIAFPLPALATPKRSASVSPELAALLGEYRRADQEQDRQHDRDYLPRYKAAHGEVDALPHTVVEVYGQRYSTSVDAHVHAARGFARSCSLPGGTAPWRKLLAAHLWRERASRRIFERTGLTAALRENDRLGDVRVECETAVARFPAASVVDLRSKLDFMIQQDMDGETGWLPQILKDVERIHAAEGR